MSSNNPSLPQFVETCVEYIDKEGGQTVSLENHQKHFISNDAPSNETVIKRFNRAKMALI
jgi:hypothetical protein